MFRTFFASLSVSGVTLTKGFFTINAQSQIDQNQREKERWQEKLDKIVVTTTFKDEESEAGSAPIKWMAEPLTDEATREAAKDSMRIRMEMMIMRVQREFCRALENEENPKYKFQVDRWIRAEGGGGITCVLQDGHTFEKAGVNVSVVHGKLPPAAVAQMNERGKKLPAGQDLPFFACGISSVIHPRNPNVPTIHFNFRYFEVEEESEGPGKEAVTTSWFGGGCDLTPYYLDEDDAKHFHKTLKVTCDKHDVKYYAKFKTWCDNYFRIKHRGISRGIGGIFFDDLDTPGKDECFNFVSDCADAIIPAYIPIVRKHRDGPNGYAERNWQLIRRGHYAEFNLVYDRGTKFGLNTPGARYESILMSLPLNAKWEYQFKEGPREAKLTEILKNPRDWV